MLESIAPGAKIVVTGGAGFIGSHIAEEGLRLGCEVHVVDDLSLGRHRNVPTGAIFHHMSLLDATGIARVIAGASVTFHEGALPSVPRSLVDPLASHNVNVTGTLNVLEGVRKSSHGRVVFAASSSAYGDAEAALKTEDLPPLPKSPYAASKVAAEAYCQAYAESYGVPVVCLRYFNVFGPRQDPNGAYAPVVPRFITAALRGQPLPIYGDGQQERDFTYVTDVVEANFLAARASSANGRAINIAGGSPITVLELANSIVALTRSSSEIAFLPERRGDVRNSAASLTRAKEVLGFSPRWSVHAGLEQTVEWMKRSP